MMQFVFYFQIYRLASTCLGSPPETITWEYYDVDKNYVKIGPIKPVDFYREYIKPVFNMQDKVTKTKPLYGYFCTFSFGH